MRRLQQGVVCISLTVTVFERPENETPLSLLRSKVRFPQNQQ